MALNPERWERVQSLFHEALGRPESERLAFLSAECAEDEALLAAVTELLEEDDRTSPLLDQNLAVAAGDILEESVGPYDRIGPYRIFEELGRGGMGVVYLGLREDTGGKAAIKILRDAALSPARRERFASEQRTLASLEHSSIARLYDADVLPDGTPFFVMEYVEGVPLTEHCFSRNHSVRERLEVFRSVCEAVQAAHQQAIVHRDLKPSNIIVREDGTLKLLDFGIAKQLDTPEAQSDPTRTLFRMMTPAYAAPEQVRGGPIGIYTDIYALGVLLYELMTGRQPFDLSTLTPGEAERAIAEQQPDRPSKASQIRDPSSRSDASRGEWADLDVMCLTAMHKDPQRRYRTVQGLIRDVNNFLRGEPLDAQPDSWRYRAGKFVRRNSRSVAAAVAVATASLALVTFYTVRLAEARNLALAEATRTQRIQDFMLSLFTGGDGSAGPADTLRVVTLIERGVREADVLDAEPAVQAELLQTLGGLYQQIGVLNQADSLLQRALDHRRSLPEDRSADLAESLFALGYLRVEQARLDEAERLVREGLSIAEGDLSPNHPVRLEGELALGRVLQETGGYEAAIPLLEDVVGRRAEVSPQSAELSDALGELANTHFYASNYEAADSLNRAVLALDRRLFGSSHPNVGDGLINLGAVKFQRGLYAEAEELYREGLGIMEAYYGSDHPETASSLTMLSRALNYQGKEGEALGHLDRALGIQLRVFGPQHPSVASTENEIGLIALSSGDLIRAEESFRRMSEVYDSVFALPHWLKGIARSNLAAVHLQAERYPDAERLFREAAGIFSETLSPDDQNTGVARIKLGRSLLRQGRWAEAEEESRAGYEILEGIIDPSVSWLQSARQDLVEAYEALGQSVEAERFRAEAAQYQKPASG